MDPRSIVFVKAGYSEPTQLLPVPTSSWTRDPETLDIGEYAYDNLSSADFTVGDFPFHEFVQHISGKSSYDMISGIREFYRSLDTIGTGEQSNSSETEKIRMAYAKELAPKLRRFVKRKDLAEIFGVSKTTISNWCPGQEEESSGGSETP